jgi:polyisoprenoid-binding protein YceI
MRRSISMTRGAIALAAILTSAEIPDAAVPATAAGSEPAGAPESPIRAAPFTLDPAQSTLGFTITRPGETIEGKAPRFTGTIHADPAHPWTGASVELRVDPVAMVTGNSMRDRKRRRSHLEVDSYPEILFESAEVAADPSPDAAGRFILSGRLRLHGVERPLRIPVSIEYHEGLLTADGAVAFTLSEFGIPIPRFLWIVLDDRVTVTFHAVATRAE